MKLTFLGTGCPEPSKRRASSGYMVDIGGETLLFDIGGGVYDRLIQAGKLPADVDRLFLTHLHSDHMMDYARLVHAGWDEGKGLLGSPPLHVFGPAPIAEIHARFFDPKRGAFAFDLEARTGNQGSQEVWLARGGELPRPGIQAQIEEIEPGWSIETEAWKITSCSVPHAQPFLTCLAFRIDDKATGKSLVYSGDAALCDELEALCTDADFLIHWCYRTSLDVTNEYIARLSPHPGEIGAMAQRAGVKRLALTHLRTYMDVPGVHDQMLAEAAAEFKGELMIAEDLVTATI